MAKCNTCGSFILWGGITHGAVKYCSNKCVQTAATEVLGQTVAEDQLEALVNEVRNGPCPQCKGPGPVDIHTSHSVMSFVVMTRWKSTPRMSCQRCGQREQLKSLGISMIAGWWGFPWGIIFTPLQVSRNLNALASPAGRNGPSEELRKALRTVLAKRVVAQARCPNCGYDVRAQRVAGIDRCPECGTNL